MMGYSIEMSMNFLIRNIHFWDYMEDHPENSGCAKGEAQKKADKFREQLYSYVKSCSMSEESIKRLKNRGLIKK